MEEALPSFLSSTWIPRYVHVEFTSGEERGLAPGPSDKPRAPGKFANTVDNASLKGI